MKNFLAHLTGIVFVFTLLIAGGCKQGTNQEGSTPEENDSESVENIPKALAADSKDVEIFIKDTMIDGRMHLEMHDSRDTTKKKIDSLYTQVYRGYNVTWKKAHKSNVKKVLDIHSTEVDGKFFGFGDTISLYRGLYTLDIPTNAEFDTIKYEIVFTVKKDGEEKESAWCIDPYLRIED